VAVTWHLRGYQFVMLVIGNDQQFQQHALFLLKLQYKLKTFVDGRLPRKKRPLYQVKLDSSTTYKFNRKNSCENNAPISRAHCFVQVVTE
jgi:hypothetical protein